MYSQIDYVADLLRKNDYNRKAVNNCLEEFNEHFNCNWNRHNFTTLVYKAYKRLVENNEIELEDYVIKLEANKQRQTDTNNYLRKVNRENFREYNVLDETYKQYVEALKQIKFENIVITPHKQTPEQKTGIFQITDTHFNTLLIPNDSLGNEYNFSIASKRFKKFVSEAIKSFIAEDVTTVYVCMTGDLISSSRRLQEVLCQNSSLCMASVLATKILCQGIIELAQHFNINVTFCVGNESRLNQNDFSGANILAAENFDFLIYHSLKLILADKGINFIAPDNLIKPLINIPLAHYSFNLILTHGNFLRCNERDYVTLASQYLNNGKKIDLIICGHFHHYVAYEHLVFAGSMIGQTEYSCNLGFVTRPSQNIYIINSKGDVSSKVIYLDDVSGVTGYKFEAELSNYAYLDRTTYNTTVTIKNLV